MGSDRGAGKEGEKKAPQTAELAVHTRKNWLQITKRSMWGEV